MAHAYEPGIDRVAVMEFPTLSPNLLFAPFLIHFGLMWRS
jgi:hypothetical protein